MKTLFFLAVSFAPAAALGGWDNPWGSRPAAPAARPAPYSREWLDEAALEETSVPRLAGLLAIRGYQLLLSPSLGSRCQFSPSCSRYTFGAVARFGLLNGALLGAERLSRCHGGAPFGDYRWNASTDLFEDPLEERTPPIPPFAWLRL